MAAIDFNTGAPAKTREQEAATTNFTQTQATGGGTTVTNGQQTTNTGGRSVQVASNYALNTTPIAKQALNDLIQTLSDRPVIDQSAALAKFPLATAMYDRSNGWIYHNPVTGVTMSETEVKAFNALQLSKQQEYIKSGGMVAGGTIEQKAQQGERQKEIERNRTTQDKYTKEAAFADSKALGDYFTRILTEQQMPSILRGAEGSGASQGTTRALLTEQAIARNAESATKTGLDAAVGYGQINNQLASTLEALTRSDPNGVAAQLLQALTTAKGIETSGSSVTVGTQDQKQVTNSTQTTTKPAETTVIARDYANTTVPAPGINAQPPAYTPSSQAGTGYIERNPMVEAAPKPKTNYSVGDANVFFED